MDRIFKDHLSNEINEQIVNVSPLSGGDINHAAHLETEHNNYFIKWNNHPNTSQMLQHETEALTIISKTRTIATPAIVKCSTLNDKAYLILDFIPQSKSPTDGNLYQFGVQLANMHKIKIDYFGFENDNYIGTLNQLNTNADTWSEFYITKRLQPQLALAKNRSYLLNISKQSIEKFYAEIHDLLKGMESSLLHGDLWNGNYIIGVNGTAYLIDPASYYGHREVDLAMTELFGGFGSSFYNGYNATYKLPQEYELRKDVYQLYYLLVHLNLFGKSYEKSCYNILSKFD